MMDGWYVGSFKKIVIQGNLRTEDCVMFGRVMSYSKNLNTFKPYDTAKLTAVKYSKFMGIMSMIFTGSSPKALRWKLCTDNSILIAQFTYKCFRDT